MKRLRIETVIELYLRNNIQPTQGAYAISSDRGIVACPLGTEMIDSLGRLSIETQLANLAIKKYGRYYELGFTNGFDKNLFKIGSSLKRKRYEKSFVEFIIGWHDGWLARRVLIDRVPLKGHNDSLRRQDDVTTDTKRVYIQS